MTVGFGHTRSIGVQVADISTHVSEAETWTGSAGQDRLRLLSRNKGSRGMKVQPPPCGSDTHRQMLRWDYAMCSVSVEAMQLKLLRICFVLLNSS